MQTDTRAKRAVIGSRGEVTVHNTSGGDLDSGEGLQITDSSFATLDPLNLWVEGDLRNGPGPCGILLAPIQDDDYGPMLLAGVCIARVDIINANHTHAWFKTGQAELRSGFAGPAEILYKPSGTGIKECLVLLGVNPQVTRKAKLDADLTAGSSAAASFYVNGLDRGSETVYFNWMEAGSTSIPLETEILAQWYDDEEKWVFVQQECAG
jgi:hypothetical protein